MKSPADFAARLAKYPVENVTKKQLKQVAQYTRQPDFDPEAAKCKSLAAAALAQWVVAVESVAKIKIQGKIAMVGGVINARNVSIEPPARVEAPKAAA